MNIKAKVGSGVIQVLKVGFCLWIITILTTSKLNAQDIHYSQFQGAPMNLSPGLTGVFQGDTRFMGNYRSQWSNVPVDYLTFTGFTDFKFIRRSDRNGFFAAGAFINYDQAGYSRLNLVNLGLSGSYTQRISEKVFATAGLQVGVAQRSFQTEELTYDNQFDSDRQRFDPTLPSRENFDRTSNVYGDFSAGLNLRFQAKQNDVLVDRLDKRTKVDVGAGLFHLNRPDQSFLDDDPALLSVRISTYALGTVMVSNNFDVVFGATAQFQKPYREAVGMLGGQFHINRSLGKQLSFLSGLGYRFQSISDAVIPTIGVTYNTWKVGISYDINISEFNLATRRRGGPEISVQYLIKRVHPLPTFKICPLI